MGTLFVVLFGRHTHKNRKTLVAFVTSILEYGHIYENTALMPLQPGKLKPYRFRGEERPTKTIFIGEPA
jgi:hypothetical protein